MISQRVFPAIKNLKYGRLPDFTEQGELIEIEDEPDSTGSSNTAFARYMGNAMFLIHVAENDLKDNSFLMAFTGDDTMDYLLDSHTHTLASGHAYNTIYEMAQAAAGNGLKLLGITEHAKEMPGTCHEIYFMNLKVLPRQLFGIEVMFGVELNIMDYDGRCREPYLFGAAACGAGFSGRTGREPFCRGV